MSCIIINEMKKEKKGEIRIIGGKWKGKKINFDLNDDLRPTPDRAKETLFNWLGQDLNQMYCLDLFSGTGALGLEAFSRGAKKVTFVEKNKKYLQKIKNIHIEMSGKDECDFYFAECLEWIKNKHNGVMIHVTRKGIKPANAEEKKNNAFLKTNSDYRIMWPTFGEDEIDHADKFVRRVMNKIYKTKIK